MVSINRSIDLYTYFKHGRDQRSNRSTFIVVIETLKKVDLFIFIIVIKIIYLFVFIVVIFITSKRSMLLSQSKKSTLYFKDRTYQSIHPAKWTFCVFVISIDRDTKAHTVRCEQSWFRKYHSKYKNKQNETLINRIKRKIKIV